MDDEERILRSIINSAEGTAYPKPIRRPEPVAPPGGWNVNQSLPGIHVPGSYPTFDNDHLGGMLAPGGRWYYWGDDGKLHYTDDFQDFPWPR